jgi:tetratricopeptide (TPR) repeat protein
MMSVPAGRRRLVAALGKRALARLTKASDGRQRRAWLMATEFGLRGATRLGAGSSYWIQLGQIREARDRLTPALEAYQRAVEVSGDGAADRRQRAHAHYRRARLYTRLKDWPSAESAYAEAVRIRPEMATWHGHRGQAQEAKEDWSAAVASFTEAVRLEPDRAEWLAGLLRASTSVGKPAAAVEAGAAALARRPEDARLNRAMATAYQMIGDWPAAVAALRDLVGRRPTDTSARAQLAECLELLHKVPFSLDHTGRLTMATEADRAAALAEAVENHARLIRDEPWRPGPSHKLAMLHERTGRMAEAMESHRAAMSRLPTVDSWWCHRAAHEWAFRLAYANERNNPGSGTSVKLGRSALPLVEDEPRVTEPAGYFEALVAYQGLQIFGFLLPGDRRSVDIYLDDQLLKQVRVDGAAWRPTVRFDVTNTLLREFPAAARLTLRSNGRPLVNSAGTEALDLRIPGGTGTVMTKLAAGATVTKKGSWPRSGDALTSRQEKYLDVYERARDALEELDRALFLCYGTLLGCHREGRFIPGDDDFDVSYVSQAPDPDAFRRECLQLSRELLRRGLDINFSINGRLFKVGLDKVWIDVTPMWFYRGRAWAFDAHNFDVEAIDPVQRTEFLGRTVYVPNQPEVVLADTYGPDWRTPQSDFRYYRSKDDDRVLSQMWSKPSEVREFAQLVEADRGRYPDAGQFAGVGVPGYPGFSWLTSADAPAPPSF